MPINSFIPAIERLLSDNPSIIPEIEMKVLFTVKLKDRNDIPGSMEFEQHIFDIKKQMLVSLGGGFRYSLTTSFDQASVLYPKRFMFDYVSDTAVCHAPKEVINAFFDAIGATGICLSKYDVHITIEWM